MRKYCLFLPLQNPSLWSSGVLLFCFVITFSTFTRAKTSPQSSLYALLVESSKDEKCFRSVQGGVFDRNRAILSNNQVIFKNAEFEKRVDTDILGRYKVRLPNGIYEVSSETKYGNLESVKRANLEVSCRDGDVELNFYIHIRTTFHDKKVKEQKVKYQYLKELTGNDWKLNALISYRNKRVDEGVIIFNDSVYSYNQITVSADKIFYKLNSSEILAEKEVLFESGKTRFYFDKLKLKYTQEGVTIEGDKKILFK